MKTWVLLACLSAATHICQAQELGKALDFWIGDWELSWKDSDTTMGAGINTITRTLDGNVMEENFQSLSGSSSGFIGRSWSVYDKRFGIWKQTWVDNQGGYLDFTGGPEEDGFVFRREAVFPNGKKIHQKMVFHDISDDRFTWDWMRSDDEGKTWKLMWQIFYTRKK